MRSVIMIPSGLELKTDGEYFQARLVFIDDPHEELNRIGREVATEEYIRNEGALWLARMLNDKPHIKNLLMNANSGATFWVYDLDSSDFDAAYIMEDLVGVHDPGIGYDEWTNYQSDLLWDCARQKLLKREAAF